MDQNAIDLGQIVITGRSDDPDEVTVSINGTAWQGWTGVRITRRAEACPNDFEVGITTLYPAAQLPSEEDFSLDRLEAVPGSKVVIRIGNRRVLTGYLDRRSGSLNANGRQFSISGRGACQDLVDSCAEWPGQRIVLTSVLGVAQDLAKPYGIEVRAAPGLSIGTPNTVFPTIGVPRGIRVFELIEEMCRIAGLLAYEAPDGALVLAEGTQNWAPSKGFDPEFPRDVAMAASGLEEGVNVIAAVGEFTAEQRFSEYRAYRYSFDRLRDVSLPNLIARTTDPGVFRKRTLDVIVEPHPQLGLLQAEQRVNFEKSIRWGRSGVVRVTTDSWRDSAGKLYEPFSLITLKLPSLGLTETVTWMISEVTYRRDGSGTLCDITAMHPLSFSRLPAIPVSPLPRDVMALNKQFARGQ